MFSAGRKPVFCIDFSSLATVLSSVKTPITPGSLKSIMVFRKVALLMRSWPVASR